MTDNKLTDAEIKKAFENCFTDNNNCDECPYYSCKNNRCTKDGDVYTLPKMIIDLINRQQAELDKYEQIKITINEFWDILLKFSIIKRKEKPTLEEFAEAIQEIKAEAYKELIGKLEYDYAFEIQRDDGYFEKVVRFESIKNVVKELVGDADGKDV